MRKRQRWLTLKCAMAGTLWASGIFGCMIAPGDPSDEELLAAAEERLIVGGSDERLLVTLAQSRVHPFGSVAALRLTPTVGQASCSAFHVGPRHLLSAAHCFYSTLDDGRFDTVTELRYMHLIRGQYGNGNDACVSCLAR